MHGTVLLFQVNRAIRPAGAHGAAGLRSGRETGLPKGLNAVGERRILRLLSAKEHTFHYSGAPLVCGAVVKPAFRRDSMRSANVGFFGCSLRKNIHFIIAGRRLVRFFTHPNDAPRLYFKSSDENAGGLMMNYSRNLYATVLLLTAARLASAATPANGYLVHNLVADQPGIADFTDPNLVN